MEPDKLRGRKLTAQSAVKLFARFYDECGPEECRRAFGWDRAQSQVRPNETTYEFSIVQVEPDPAVPDKRVVVGFGTIELNTHNADDTEASLVLGVFPKHRRRGHWNSIMTWLVDRARKLGADSASQIVFKENEEHYNRVRAQARPEGPWIYAGDVWYPMPGYGYFVHPLDK